MRYAAALASVVLLAGCSSPSTGTSTPTATATEQTSVAPVAFASAGGSAEVVAALAEHVPTITLTTAFTEDNDPNKQLGRPGGYIGKAAFADSRVPTADRNEDKAATDNGGGVEIFTTAGDAQARSEYIAAALKGGGGMLGTEYLYVSGPALLRVSGNLTPTMAREYEAAWPGVVAEVLK